MTLHMATDLNKFLLPLLVISITTACMEQGEKKSLTLSCMDPKINQKKESKTYSTELRITSQMKPATGYGDPLIHQQFESTNCPTKLNDLITYIEVTDRETNKVATTCVPTKLFFNCNNGSNIQIRYHNELDDNELDVIVHGICKPNSNISNQSFREQLAQDMQKFYKKAVFNGANQEELENADILIATMVNKTNFVIVTEGATGETMLMPFTTQKIKYNHGKNGCANDQQFEQILFNNAPATQSLLQKNNKLFFVMDRQTGQHKKKQHPTILNPAAKNIDCLAISPFAGTTILNILIDEDERKLLKSRPYCCKAEDRHGNECTIL